MWTGMVISFSGQSLWSPNSSVSLPGVGFSHIPFFLNIFLFIINFGLMLSRFKQKRLITKRLSFYFQNMKKWKQTKNWLKSMIKNLSTRGYKTALPSATQLLLLCYCFTSLSSQTHRCRPLCLTSVRHPNQLFRFTSHTWQLKFPWPVTMDNVRGKKSHKQINNQPELFETWG